MTRTFISYVSDKPGDCIELSKQVYTRANTHVCVRTYVDSMSEYVLRLFDTTNCDCVRVCCGLCGKAADNTPDNTRNRTKPCVLQPIFVVVAT